MTNTYRAPLCFIGPISLSLKVHYVRVDGQGGGHFDVDIAPGFMLEEEELLHYIAAGMKATEQFLKHPIRLLSPEEFARRVVYEHHTGERLGDDEPMEELTENMRYDHVALLERAMAYAESQDAEKH